MRLSNLRFAPLLTGSFALLLILIVLLWAIGMVRMSQTGEQLRSITQDHNAQARLVGKMAIALHRAQEAIRVLPLLQDEQRLAQQQTEYEQTRVAYDAALKEVSTGTKLEDDEKSLLAQAAAARQVAEKLNEEIVKLSMESRVTEATDLIIGDARVANDAWADKLEKLVVLQDSHSLNVSESETGKVRTGMWLMTLLGLLGLLLGGFVAWWATRAVTIPLKAAVGAAQGVAAGRLDSAVTSEARNETGELLRAIGTMTTSLREVVSGVRGSAQSISGATAQVAGAASELSTRTEETASSLEETAASMEQFSSTVAQNADNAKQAASFASKAAAVATEGGKAFSQIVDSMSAVDSSAKKIVDIIAVIDGIAFQTNILALNAAVEAARAGEQGRGFAVVAGEVRILAQRSAAAAKEIAGLIRGSAEQIANASNIVTQASGTMQQILESNEQVRRLINDIANASAEQRTGISQVSSAVQQMERVSQQNAHLVQQTAAASEAMMQQAKKLVDAVNFFHIGDSTKAAAATATASAASKAVQRAATPPAASAAERLSQAEAPRLPKIDNRNDDEWTTF